MHEDTALSAIELLEKYDETCTGHPDFTIDDWAQAVTQGETKRGYWDWVVAQIAEFNDEHDD